MDPISLAASIAALIGGITKLSVQVGVFVSEVRDAQSEMNRVKQELEALTAVLVQLRERDGSQLPPQLIQSLPSVLDSCTDVVVEMIDILQRLSSRNSTLRRIRWVTGARSDIGALRANLEAHKSTINLTIMISSAKSDQLILGEIALLQRSLPRGSTGFTLQRFLEDTATYAGSAYSGSVFNDSETLVQEPDEERNWKSPETPPPGLAPDQQSSRQSPPFINQRNSPRGQDAELAANPIPRRREAALPSGRAQGPSAGNQRSGLPTNPDAISTPIGLQTDFDLDHKAISRNRVARSFMSVDGQITLDHEFFAAAHIEAYQDSFAAVLEGYLERGADVNATPVTPTETTVSGNYLSHGSALAVSCFWGKQEAVRLLLRHGARVNGDFGGYYSASPLQEAAINGHRIIVECLLQRGADVNASAGRHGTALEAAKQAGRTGMDDVSDLLRRFALQLPPLQNPLLQNQPLQRKVNEAIARLGANQALALFTFEAQEPGDLGFKKGEIITIVKRTERTNDWWTGRIGTREGIFPRNYVTEL